MDEALTLVGISNAETMHRALDDVLRLRTTKVVGGPTPMPLIVVVDDRVTNREIFTKLAASIDENIIVKAFGQPVAALAWMTEHEPDLVITDYKMPNLDGAEFIRRLRVIYDGADVPVIAITAYEDRAFRLLALEAGATDFLQSPVDHQEFLTRARNLLRLGQQQKIIRSRADLLSRELAESERSRESAIRTSSARLAEVIDTIPALISAVDKEGRCVFVNKYGEAIMAADETAQPRFSPPDMLVRSTGRALPTFEEQVIDRHGQPRTLLTSKYPLHDADGAVGTVLTTSFDITEQKAVAQELRYLAHHDGLTGLPNRLQLHGLLTAEIERSTVTGRAFALHFIDLDRFKGINDAFGHDHGDKLLLEVAGRLRRSVRQSDVVARLGGDEFAVVQRDVERHEDATMLADHIIAELSVPVPVEERSVTVGASVGITLCPNDGTSVEQLIKNADLAMYAAKHAGRGRSHLFAWQLQISAREVVLLEIDLRESIKRGDFVLCYQPQVDATTGRLVGAEALIRWQRPGSGLVYPGSFISIAEKTGLIVPLDRWVMHEACTQAAAWARAGTPVRIAVNVSSAVFRTESVRELVEHVLTETGLAPELLEIELTETTLLENQREAAVDLHALRRLGVRVAIDDFGTGFSSLAYLKLLPVDRLKVDQSFVRGLGTDPGDAAIVRAIVGIGRSLGIDVLAEGIETDEQLKQVQSEGCNVVQGFLFSHAQAACDLELMLAPDWRFAAARPPAKVHSR